MTTPRPRPILRTARHLTRIHADPARSSPEVGWTQVGARYQIKNVRLVAAEFWFEIAQGWVVEGTRGVMTWREMSREAK